MVEPRNSGVRAIHGWKSPPPNPRTAQRLEERRLGERLGKLNFYKCLLEVGGEEAEEEFAEFLLHYSLIDDAGHF
jgi:hypothetical protein